VTTPAAPTIAALVFDMDGLMLDTEPIYRTSWQRTAAELGWELTDHAYEAYIGRRTEDCERELAERWGPTFPIDAFRKRWPDVWRDLAGQGLATKPGLHALLDFAAARNLPTAVATSTERTLAEYTLRCGGLAIARFSVIVTGDEIANGKPAPDIYLEAARRLGLAPARCAALEDSDAGILSASRAGMRALMVPDLKPPSPEAAGEAFRVLRSLEDALDLVAALVDG
jgi:HAD superfamily hydrolase (TIGR01509 family)